jgi:hypothetical protein
MIPRTAAMVLLIGGSLAAVVGGSYLASVERGERPVQLTTNQAPVVPPNVPPSAPTGPAAQAPATSQTTPAATPGAGPSTPGSGEAGTTGGAAPQGSGDGAQPGGDAPIPRPPLRPRAQPQYPPQYFPPYPTPYPAPAPATPGAPGAGAPGAPPVAGAPAAVPPTGPMTLSGAASGNESKDAREITVPANTLLEVQLEAEVSSETAKPEQALNARVSRDIRMGSDLAVPSGTKIKGVITKVERPGKVSGKPRLELRFESLLMADGSVVEIQTPTLFWEGPSQMPGSAAKVGGAALTGALAGLMLKGTRGALTGAAAGAATGTAATMSGPRTAAVLPAGGIFDVRLLFPIKVYIAPVK